MGNIIDITDFTDDELDKLLELKSGAECVTFEGFGFSSIERVMIAAGHSVEKAREIANHCWERPHTSALGAARWAKQPDYEGRILARQERDEEF